MSIKIGDTVRHKVSRECWIVAKIYENGDIIPAGWPCSLEKGDGVELIDSCSEEEHQFMIERLKCIPSDDPRFIASRSTHE